MLTLVREGETEAEEFYLQFGPNKHEQDDHYRTGISIVDMNITLLSNWLDTKNLGSPKRSSLNSPNMPAPTPTRTAVTEEVITDSALEYWDNLNKADRREIWEASGFHFGMMGYEPHDADFWWEHEAQD
jgi:hypothetical protein